MYVKSLLVHPLNLSLPKPIMSRHSSHRSAHAASGCGARDTPTDTLSGCSGGSSSAIPLVSNSRHIHGYQSPMPRSKV